MIEERWQQVAGIYEAALERSEEERGVFLDAACAGDVMLRQEVDTLLMQERAAGPLDRPVWVADSLIVEAASLAVGASIGVYRIEGVLGAGGMGQVYRARDTKLGRGVALKVLPDMFARDPERRARFQREAQVLAALNHPHIAAIHGFEDSGSIHALVLELVEGPTLAERLAQGPHPARRDHGHRAVDRRRARSRTRSRYRAPQSQAGQHQAQARRHRQGPRFRSRSTGAARRGD